MDEKDSEQAKPGASSRRQFIGALGATAASAAFLQHFAKGDQGTVWYQDSWGNTVPASPAMIAMGCYPPPTPAPQSPGQPEAQHGHGHKRLEESVHREFRPESTPPGYTGTYLQPGYTSPNILIIMVDQLRAPRWLPSGGQHAIDLLLPSITALRNQSVSFGNYFPAATACSPSRSTLLSGLYTQQTCIFQTQDTTTCEPSLNTGFPNIATVLSQTGIGGGWIPYTCFWIGKWHLSDPAGSTTDPGPTGYGFSTTPNLNLPKDGTIPSPNGTGNEGTEGTYYNSPSWVPSHGPFPPGASAPGITQYSDTAICDFFIQQWIPNAPAQPWCTTVSFVNPHDITGFPFTFNLTAAAPPAAPTKSFPVPLTAGSPGVGAVGSPQYNDTYLPALTPLYGSAAPTGWNYPDAPAGYSSGLGKPSLQTAFQTHLNQQYGVVSAYSGGGSGAITWQKFLNYYFWMQKCVDVQVGRVMAAVAGFTGAASPIVIFLSDHGDYGGSHSLHAKAGALYDESINVPLYVSLPAMRQGTKPVTPSSYVCSSVDILPFLYSMALGSDTQWRHNSGDYVYYLRNRESIMDAIYSSMPQQHRLSGIANQNGSVNGQYSQPYIFHTTDEFSEAQVPGGGGGTLVLEVPSHAIAFRTVDLSVNHVNADGNGVNGGGKLGIYSFWPAPNASNLNYTQTQPIPMTTQEFEFYDYTGTQNFGETGNEYTTNAAVTNFENAFASATVQGELYLDLSTTAIQSVYQAALLNYENAQLNTSACPSLSPSNDV